MRNTDGVLTVSTAIGLVPVPAGLVGCYGLGCLGLLDDPRFGLTADAFVEVVIGEGVAPAPDTANDASGSFVARSDSLTLSVTDPGIAAFLPALADRFVATNDQGISGTATPETGITLSRADTQEDLDLQLVAGAGDAVVGFAPLGASTGEAFASARDWAEAESLGEQMIGLQAFAIVVSGDVGIAAMTLEQLAGIYAGEITNWSALGGPDQRIIALQLPPGDPTRDALITLVMTPAGKTIASDVLTMADEAGIAGSVTQFPGSISFVRLANADSNQTAAVVGSCGIAVAPETFNVLSGDYPLAVPVTAQFPSPPETSLVAALLDFAATSDAIDLASEAGLVALDPMREPNEVNDSRLTRILDGAAPGAIRDSTARMFELLFDADRLSPTFIGGSTTAAQAAWNRAMMQNLAETLSSPSFAARQIYFVGLADGAAGEQEALSASIQAASNLRDAFEEVAADIISRNFLRVSWAGFGGAAPVTCYDNQDATPAASRVEVWVR